MRFSDDILSTRFGYGLPLPQGAPTTALDMLTSLSGPDLARAAWPVPSAADHLPLLQDVLRLRHQQNTDAEVATYKAALDVVENLATDGSRATVVRALSAADGFRERLVAFWANHFCTRFRTHPMAYLPVLLIEEAIRPHLTGSFADMLIAATTHPAMVTYLDQAGSVGPNSPKGQRRKAGLNENLAREVMELHSLGVGAPYTQADVRQMAELLTGVTFEPDTGATFDADLVDPGDKTVLGKTYSGEGRVSAVLTDLAQRPETARHIAGKLARHFLADLPPQTVVDAMTQAFTDSGGQLLAVYAALLAAPEAASQDMAKVRWPADYLVTALRAVGASGSDVMALPRGPYHRLVTKALAAMGQPFITPPGPNGFPEQAEAWINPPYLAVRIAWSMRMPHDLLGRAPDPQDVLDRALGARASDALRQAVARAETKVEAVGLILASTELNRR